MSYATTQRQVKENVLTLLEEIEATRNSDQRLMVEYWERFDGVVFGDNFKDHFLTQGTKPESITRARRSIQAGGLYLPTDEDVLRQRRMLQDEARLHHGANG